MLATKDTWVLASGLAAYVAVLRAWVAEVREELAEEAQKLDGAACGELDRLGDIIEGGERDIATIEDALRVMYSDNAARPHPVIANAMIERACDEAHAEGHYAPRHVEPVAWD